MEIDFPTIIPHISNPEDHGIIIMLILNTTTMVIDVQTIYMVDTEIMNMIIVIEIIPQLDLLLLQDILPLQLDLLLLQDILPLQLDLLLLQDILPLQLDLHDLQIDDNEKNDLIILFEIYLK
jgi:hypothetical protein